METENSLAYLQVPATFAACGSDFRTPHHNASNQEESPVLSSEFITYLDTLLHMDRNEDTYIPTTDQALLRRTAPPTTQASDRVRPAPPEFVEHLI